MTASSSDLGAGLTSILDGLASRADALKHLSTLRQLGPSDESDLERIALAVQELEVATATRRAEIAQQTTMIEELRSLRDDARATGARLAAAQAALPTHLPGDHEVVPPPPRQPLVELDAAPSNAAPQSVIGQPLGGAIPVGAPRGTKTRKPPTIAYVTEPELQSAPQYMRSRLTLEKLNGAVHELQQLLNTKYALLSVPSSQLKTLSDADRKRHSAFRELETTLEQKSRAFFFVSETDLKSSQTLNQGQATGKNILAVLRHCSRIKEFKHQGLRCWHTR